MARRDEGSTPIERLQNRFTTDDITCPECGFEDDDGEWTAMTDGSTILYRHVCPSCGEIRTRTYTVTE